MLRALTSEPDTEKEGKTSEVSVTGTKEPLGGWQPKTVKNVIAKFTFGFCAKRTEEQYASVKKKVQFFKKCKASIFCCQDI
jgi:hypothetical protein